MYIPSYKYLYSVIFFSTNQPGYCCMGPDGCRACECDPGGSLNPQCHHGNGTCDCRSGVIGQKCDSLAPNRFLVTGLTLAEARKLPINGDFAFWVKINPDVSLEFQIRKFCSRNELCSNMYCYCNPSNQDDLK